MLVFLAIVASAGGCGGVEFASAVAFGFALSFVLIGGHNNQIICLLKTFFTIM